MARIAVKRANIENLQKLYLELPLVNLRPLVAYVMHQCGCTYDEIGQVFNITRQQAHGIVRRAKDEI